MTPGKVMGEGRFRICMFGRQPVGFTGSSDLAREKVTRGVSSSDPMCVPFIPSGGTQDVHAQYTRVHGPSRRAEPCCGRSPARQNTARQVRTATACWCQCRSDSIPGSVSEGLSLQTAPLAIRGSAPCAFHGNRWLTCSGPCVLDACQVRRQTPPPRGDFVFLFVNQGRGTGDH